MRRRIAVFLATVLAAGSLALFAGAQPASAIEICGGQGFANTSPVFYPPFGSTDQKAFAFTFTGGVAGACVHLPSGTMDKTLTASGTFLGYCGLSSGTGTTGNGSLFAWIGVGSLLILTGHMVGVVNATPDTLSGSSCSPTGPGATRFIVSGLAVLLNCTSLVLPDGPLTLYTVPLPPIDLPAPFTKDIEPQELHIWVNSPCVPDPLNL